MLSNIKRALAVSAALPLALAGAAGAANATTDPTTDYSGNSETVVANCYHPNFPYGFDPYSTLVNQLRMRVTVQTEGSFLADSNDIDFMSIDATDNNRPFTFYEAYAKASSATVRYQEYDVRDNRYETMKTLSYGASFADGQVSVAGRDNVDRIRVDVNWSAVGKADPDAKSLRCYIDLPSSS